jgi:hypothetical protein
VPFVWVDTPSGPVAKHVELGLNDFQFVEVTDGLEEGDAVYLAAPPGAVEPEFEQPERSMAAPAAETPPTDGAAMEAAAPGVVGRSDDPDGRQSAPAGESAQNTLTRILEQKYPDLAKAVAQDRRAWFSNDELKQALEQDDELRAARDAWMQEMRARGGNRGPGNRGPGEGGRRGGRSRRGDGERGEGKQRVPSPSDGERHDGDH